MMQFSALVAFVLEKARIVVCDFWILGCFVSMRLNFIDPKLRNYQVNAPGVHPASCTDPPHQMRTHRAHTIIYSAGPVNAGQQRD